MIHAPFKGHFVTLEGGEGAGKSTLLFELAAYFTQRGFEVITTREPGGSRLGEVVRDWLLRQDATMSICPEAELLLFLAARAQHIRELILPALESGKVVLCDRFNDSTIAYQGGARGLGVKYTQDLCHLVCGKVEPQLTLLLNVTPEVGLHRSRGLEKEQSIAGELDRIESEDLAFHKRLNEAFKALAKREPFRIYTIDADRPQADVLKEAKRAIDEFIILPSRKGK